MRRLIWLFAFTLVVVGNVRGACSFDAARAKGIKLLEGVTPKVSGSATYRQKLRLPNGVEVPLKSETDYRRREIPLAILDLDTCSVSTLTTKWETKNSRVIGPLDLPEIVLEPRVFGPIRNGLNTQFQISGNRVVIAEKWKVFGRDEYIYSTPYSGQLHSAFPLLVHRGREHLRRDTEAALAYLSERKLIHSDQVERFGYMMPLLVMVETIDPLEFKLSDEAGKSRLAEKPLVYIGANGNETMTRKVSSVGARGPAQVWYKTCKDLLEDNPGTGINSDCNGAKGVDHSHIGNLAAGIMIGLEKREELLAKLSILIVDGPEGDRLIAASYNGGAGRVRRAFLNHGGLWDRMHMGWTEKTVRVKTKKGVKEVIKKEYGPTGILEETVDYVPKFDFVKQAESSVRMIAALLGGAP